MRSLRDGWVLAGIIAAAIALLAVVGPSPEKESKLSTTYNSDSNGVKAFYTLLGERLGNRVERLRDPYTNLPSDAKILVVVAPLDHKPIAPDEIDALQQWIRSGNTAIFITNSHENIPNQFEETQLFGKGFIYSFDSINIISNRGMRNYRNAVRLVDIISKHAGPKDLILFDEYHHAISRSPSFSILAHIGRQVKIGAVLAAVAILLLCYGRGRRFGAVRNLPSWENRRPGFDYVESIARLYARAGAADLAIDILTKSMRQELCVKFGLSTDATREAIVRQIELDGKVDLAQKVDKLLSINNAGQKLDNSELVYIAREIHAVEKELGLGGIIA